MPVPRIRNRYEGPVSYPADLYRYQNNDPEQPHWIYRDFQWLGASGPVAGSTQEYMREIRTVAVPQWEREASGNSRNSYNDVWHDRVDCLPIFRRNEHSFSYHDGLLNTVGIGTPNLVTNDSQYTVVAKRTLRDAVLDVAVQDLGSRPTDSDILDKNVFPNQQLPRQILIDRNPFDTEFSIWYLLVDLIDLKKTISRLLSNQGAMRALRRTGLPKEATARKIANTNLGIQFGVIPTVKDIQDFVSRIKTWSEAYDKVSDLQKKRFRFHRKMDIRSLFPPKDWVRDLSLGPFQGLTVTGTFRVTERTEVASWHGMALYGFACPEFTGWLCRIKQIFDAFGILDPAAVWDAIPFTFVIDWFLSVGSWLHSNRPILFPANCVIYDYLESIKVSITRTYSADVLWCASDSSPYYFNNPGPFWVDKYVSYVRRRFQPSPGHLSIVSGLNTKRSLFNWRRLSIASSLIAQRLPR